MEHRGTVAAHDGAFNKAREERAEDTPWGGRDWAASSRAAGDGADLRQPSTGPGTQEVKRRFLN